MHGCLGSAFGATMGCGWPLKLLWACTAVCLVWGGNDDVASGVLGAGDSLVGSGSVSLAIVEPAMGSILVCGPDYSVVVRTQVSGCQLGSSCALRVWMLHSSAATQDLGTWTTRVLTLPAFQHTGTHTLTSALIPLHQGHSIHDMEVELQGALAVDRVVFDAVPATAPMYPHGRGSLDGSEPGTARCVPQQPLDHPPRTTHGGGDNDQRVLNVVFVGSTSFDGQKNIWLQQMRYLPAPAFKTRYVTFSAPVDVDEVLQSGADGGSNQYSLIPVLEKHGLLTALHSVELMAPGWISPAVAANLTGYLQQCLVDANYSVSDTQPVFARTFWSNIVEAFDGADIVVYGNTQAPEDAIVVAGAALAGVGNVVMELPNVYPDPAQRPTVVVSPSRATWDGTRRHLAAGLANPSPAVLASTPLTDPEHEATALQVDGDAAAVQAGDQLFPVPAGVVINPGVDPTRFQLKDALRTRRRRRQSGTRKVVGVVARLSPEKSLGLLLHASRLVHKRFPGVEFHIVGSGAAMEPLQLLAHHLHARVTFLGRVYDELPQVLETFDMVVFLGLWGETFGIANLEALAAEVPVVAFADAGQSEYLVDGVTGVVIQQPTPWGIAAAIVRIVTHPVAAVASGMTGHTLVHSELTTGAMVRRYGNLYSCLAACPRDVRPRSPFGASRPSRTCVDACVAPDGVASCAGGTPRPPRVGGSTVRLSPTGDTSGHMTVLGPDWRALISVAADVRGCTLGVSCALEFYLAHASGDGSFVHVGRAVTGVVTLVANGVVGTVLVQAMLVPISSGGTPAGVVAHDTASVEVVPQLRPRRPGQPRLQVVHPWSASVRLVVVGCSTSMRVFASQDQKQFLLLRSLGVVVTYVCFADAADETGEALRRGGVPVRLAPLAVPAGAIPSAWTASPRTFLLQELRRCNSDITDSTMSVAVASFWGAARDALAAPSPAAVLLTVRSLDSMTDGDSVVAAAAELAGARVILRAAQSGHSELPAAARAVLSSAAVLLVEPTATPVPGDAWRTRVPMGVSTGPLPVLTRWPRDARRLAVGFAGRLDAGHGMGLLCLAMHSLPSETVAPLQMTLRAAGSGVEPTLRLCEQLGVSVDVGGEPHASRRFEDIDVLVVTGTGSAAGDVLVRLGILEAFAAGCLVVAMQATGLEELLVDQTTAVVLSAPHPEDDDAPASVTALADAIGRVAMLQQDVAAVESTRLRAWQHAHTQSMQAAANEWKPVLAHVQALVGHH